MAMADWLRECRVDTVAMEATIKSASVHVQRMQKVLIQMNLHLHKVISDVTGLTGMKIRPLAKIVSNSNFSSNKVHSYE